MFHGVRRQWLPVSHQQIDVRYWSRHCIIVGHKPDAALPLWKLSSESFFHFFRQFPSGDFRLWLPLKYSSFATVESSTWTLSWIFPNLRFSRRLGKNLKMKYEKLMPKIFFSFFFSHKQIVDKSEGDLTWCVKTMKIKILWNYSSKIWNKNFKNRQ